MSPKVSICIPTYKQVIYLQKTLDSIVEQNYTDYELIITDDSPNDDVKKLIDTYDFKGKLHYYKNSLALGSPQNWNACISKAKGEYIKIMHHDDWFTQNNSLEKFMLEAEKNKSNFIFSEAISFNEKENTKKIHTPGKTFLEQLVLNPEYLFLGNLIGPPSSVMWLRKDTIAFNNQLKWLVDVDFFISMIKKNNGFSFIAEPLITSVNNGLHNVTNECNNAEVEVFEYFYLFDSLSSQSKKDKQFISVLINLLVRYKIKDIKEFKKYCGNLLVDKAIIKIVRKAKIIIQLNKIKSYFNVN